MNLDILLNMKEGKLIEHHVQLLKKSFRMMNIFRVTQSFYSKLFERHPETKALFSTDLFVQTEKLTSVLELVVFSFEEKSNFNYELQDSLLVPLRDLGKKHEEIGIKPEHYSIASTLLLEAIEEEVGSSFSDDLRFSWEVALNQMASAMLDSQFDQKIILKTPRNSFFSQVLTGLMKYVK